MTPPDGMHRAADATPETTLRSASDLVAHGLIAPADAAAIARVAERYAIALPPTLLHALDPAGNADPIRRQFVPDAAELTTTPEEREIGRAHV
mgnify:FL=1